MSKQKFQIGDKVATIKFPYDIGTITDIDTVVVHQFRLGPTPQNTRKKYLVKFEDKSESKWFYSYKLQFADLHALAKHAGIYHDIPDLSKKEKEEMGITGPYGYVPSFSKEKEKLNNSYIHPVLPPEFQEGDIVTYPFSKHIPNIGKVIKVSEENGKYYYTIKFTDGAIEQFGTLQLCKGSLNDKFLYDEFIKIGELAEGIGPKDKCKYCETPFEEIEESTEEKGACEYCVEQRNCISEVNHRKAANVDLGKFSIYGHKNDWLEVTEWTNGEGIDVLIHYANDHDETDHIFKLSYDELTAIVNIVNKFGRMPIIFTEESPNKNKN